MHKIRFVGTDPIHISYFELNSLGCTHLATGGQPALLSVGGRRRLIYEADQKFFFLEIHICTH